MAKMINEIKRNNGKIILLALVTVLILSLVGCSSDKGLK